MLVARALRPGRRRRDDLGGDPGDDRDDVPASPREQAKAIGVYAFVASAGGSIGLLAGGVLTQAINWHWIFFVNVPIGIATAAARSVRLLAAATRASGSARVPTFPGAVLITGALMLGVYTIVKPAAEHGWGASAHARAGRRLRSCCSAVFLVREATRAQAADAAAHLSLAQRRRRQPGPGAVRRRDVRDVLPRRAVPAAACCRYDALEIGLAFLPMTVDRWARCRSATPSALVMRFGARNLLIPGLAADRGRACSCSRGRRSTAATSTDVLPRDGAARDRRRHLLPGADDAGDVRRARRATPGSPRAW